MLALFVIGGVSAQDVDDASDILLVDSPSQVNIDVNYEFTNDNGKITPTFDAVNATVESQDYDSANKYYNVKVNSTQASDKLNISISAPGYLSQYKLVDANGASPVKVDMIASDAYKLGHDVTARADALLNFKEADAVLAITTAGVPKLNGKTSEAAIDGILNYATDYISYGRGNILMLRQTAVDPIDFCFVVKKGTELTAAIFLNGKTEEVYLGTISEYMTTSQWNALFKAVGGENAFSFASLANGWYDGVTFDVLQEAAFHGHICEGTLGGYTITKALLQYYPPIQETGNGLQSPGDITSYKVLSVPGDSASDALIFFLDATAGKSSYVGFDTSSTGATTNMVGFIRWNDKTNNGTIIVMDYNSEKNKELFQKETGITGDGSLEELKYNTWWINKIYTNPGSLVSILIEKEGLTYEQYLYLVGTESDEEDDDGTIINATNSHGLDYAYIQGLDLPNATRSNALANKGSLTYDDFKAIGQKAASMAKEIYERELGVQIHKDMPNLMVLTSAGYVLINEQTTEACWDGIFEELGLRLCRGTLLPHHKPIWTPLFFNFVLQLEDGSLMSIYMRYNQDGTFYVGEFNRSQTYNFNRTILNQSAISGGINKNVYIDGNYFGIQSISNAWGGKPAFDQLITFLFHNHACPGVQPGFFIADYIQENFPLNENLSYIYIANEQYCKEDSLEYMLDISPGLGNYLVQKLTSDEYKGENDLDEEGILIIWDSANNIGQAVTISYQWPSPDLSAYATSESKRAAQIQAFLDLYNGRDNPILTENYHTIAHGDSRWITEEQRDAITSGGEGSSLQYLRSLDDISREDLLKQIAEKEKNGNNAQESNGTNTNINTNTESNNANANSASSASSQQAVPSRTATTQGSSSSVGVSSSPVRTSTQASEDTSSESSDETPSDEKSSDSSKSYEIEKKPVSKSGDNNLVYAVIGALVIGALFGVGYMRTKKE